MKLAPGLFLFEINLTTLNSLRTMKIRHPNDILVFVNEAERDLSAADLFEEVEKLIPAYQPPPS